MPNSRAEEESSHKEPGATSAPEGTDEQDQNGTATKGEKTFLEHAEDSMNEYAELGRPLAQ